jgi:pimeloyl-ACP methyl ester carboxylesterase
MWRDVVPGLVSRGYHCVMPDLRGLGWTSAPAGGYDKPQLALDVLALLDSLSLPEPLLVMGHDWGGITTVFLCEQAPERFAKAIVLSIPAPWDAQPDPRRLLGFAHMPLLSAPGAAKVVPQLAGFLLRASGIRETEAYTSVLSEPERRRATVGYYRTFVTRELPRLAVSPPPRPLVPMRLLGGDRDPVCRFSPSVEKVHGIGHFLPEQKPAAVLSLVDEFFA